MENFVLYCKSWSGDLERCINLSKSIQRHNIDKIPFYLSVPQNEVSLFKEKLPYFDEIIADESYCEINKGWNGQQFVKALFYKTNISRFYLSIDSDSYFFKDFYLSDFMYSDIIPYMVIHSNETFYSFWDRYKDKFHWDARLGHENEYKSIMNHFGRSGKIYDYSPSPFIWDTDVWQWLDNEWGIINLFKKHCNELKWYGEGALAKGVAMMPTGPLFACMHYPEQYEVYKTTLGYTEEHFHPQYLGMVMQSNWGSPLKF